MKDRLTPSNFDRSAKRYHEWSGTAPSVWTEVEEPALAGAVCEVVSREGTNIKVLDVGIGGGKVAMLLTWNGISTKSITGLDINPSMLSLVKKNQPELTLVKANIAQPKALDSLKFAAPFDLITASMVLNHLNDRQIVRAAENIFQLLKDGGNFIGLVPYPRFPENPRITNTEVSAIEDAPWGGKVKYKHHAFGLIHEVFESRGFYMSLRAVGMREGKTPRRLLVCGVKSLAFRGEIEKHGMFMDSRTRDAYVDARI